MQVLPIFVDYGGGGGYFHFGNNHFFIKLFFINVLECLCYGVKRCFVIKPACMSE
ncbi:hypothetical protein [Helicobacter pullorum]|uniref:hypothetical protein n=1 Tax=Helicobacter pullorum TaxID=35818 RepID=UPI00320A613F